MYLLIIVLVQQIVCQS